jgi:phage FluMu protein gp41
MGAPSRCRLRASAGLGHEHVVVVHGNECVSRASPVLDAVEVGRQESLLHAGVGEVQGLLSLRDERPAL